MSDQFRIIHYLNQFFGGMGGEEKANLPLKVIQGPVGPGIALQKALGTEGAIAETLACGDNYFHEEKEEVIVGIKQALKKCNADVLIAGPAFNAGRYGLACGEVCKIAQRQGIPAVTAMYSENPGVLEHRREVYILPTDEKISDMRLAIGKLAQFALKLARGAPIASAEDEGYLSRGFRRSAEASEQGYKRAVDMLVAKLHGDPFRTEIPVLLPERVKPAPPIPKLNQALIAFVTTCGLIPEGNPEGQVAANSERYFRYSIEGKPLLDSKDWGAFHGGYYNAIASSNPNYILPLSQLNMLKSEGCIGEIYPWIFSLSGCSTSVANSKKIGAGIAQDLIEADVDGCLLLSA